MQNLKVVKKQGLINEEGKVVIPIEYKRIKQLQSGVIIAKTLQVKIHEDKSAPAKYYHHCKVQKIEDRSNYHLYTVKGRIFFNDFILDYKVDNNGNIVALQTESGWQLVSVDCEKNVIKVLHSNIPSILAVTNGCVVTEKISGNVKRFVIYSIEDMSNVFEVTEASKIRIEKKGFVFTHKNTGLEALFNFSGNMILDYKWNSIVCRENYIRVQLNDKDDPRRPYWGAYSYDGKMIIPCECMTLKQVKVEIGSKTTEIFHAGKNFEDFHKRALIDLAGNEILPYGGYDSFSFMKGNCVIIEINEEQKQEILCKIEELDGKLSLRKIIKADRVFEMHNNKYLFKVKINNKVGVYDCLGNEIVPIKYHKVEWKVGTQYITAINRLGKNVKIPANIPDEESIS